MVGSGTLSGAYGPNPTLAARHVALARPVQEHKSGSEKGESATICLISVQSASPIACCPDWPMASIMCQRRSHGAGLVKLL